MLAHFYFMIDGNLLCSTSFPIPEYGTVQVNLKEIYAFDWTFLEDETRPPTVSQLENFTDFGMV